MVCLIFNLCESYHWIKPSKLMTYKFKTSPSWNKVCDIFVLVPWKRELGEVKKWLSSKEFGLVWLFFFFQSVGTQWTRSFLPPWDPFTHLLVSIPWFFFEELPFPIFGLYNLSGYLSLRTPEGDKWPQPGQWLYFSSLARVLLRDIAH